MINSNRFIDPISFRRAAIVSLLSSMTALIGCATQPGTITNEFSLPSNNSVLTGARQRAILNVPAGRLSRAGLIDPNRIVCAEPSPDVALALAQSFGFGISIFGQGSGSGAVAQAEGIAQLAERTASIQLLRDQMYRACEAYANGAITGTTYNLIMSKTNDAMVTMMLGEIAGGAFGRSLSAIGGVASSTGEATLDQLQDIQRNLGNAERDLQDAQQEEGEANREVAEAEENVQADPTPSNNAALEQAQEEQNRARVQRRRMERNLTSTKAEASAQISQIVGAGSVSSKPSVRTASVISGMHGQFLREDFADEYISACLVELGLAPDDVNAAITAVEQREREQEKARIQLQIDTLPKGDKKIESLELQKNLVDVLPAKDLDHIKKMLDRVSMLASHCKINLYEFIKTAHENEVDLEKKRIALDLNESNRSQIESRKMLADAFNKNLERCSALDENLRQVCIHAATLIVSGDGIIEVGGTQVVKVPAHDPPLPLSWYKKAQKFKKEYITSKGDLVKNKVPNTTNAELKKEHENLTKERKDIEKKINDLDLKVNKELDDPGNTEKESAVVLFQANRDKLRAELELLSADDELSRQSVQLAIKQHDVEAEMKIALYSKLHEEMKGIVTDIQMHLEKLKNFLAKNK